MDVKSQLVSWVIRYFFTILGTYLVAHGHDGAAAYISTNVDTVIGLISGAIGIGLSGHKAVTTIAVPKNDPVAAQVAVQKVNANVNGGANR